VVSDVIPLASGSKISSLSLGDPLTVNLAVGPLFQVDTKGLAVGASLTDFQAATTTDALRVGQEVAIQVSAFTAANGSTFAIANNTGTVTLRWSRFTASPTGAVTAAQVNITNMPAYFGVTSSSIFGVQVFQGTQGTGIRGVTNLDGVANAGNLNANNPVAFRALYIEDQTNTVDPAFFAAKIRQQ
jgi:hypothetical protein